MHPGDRNNRTVIFVYVCALSNCFVLSQLYNNEYSTYHFLIMIKDSMSFSRVITLQEFKTVTFNVLLVHKSTFPVSFLLNNKRELFKSVQ